MGTKAAQSIEHDKYTNSIRFMNKLKDHQVLTLKPDTPFHRVFPILKDKTKLHIVKLF